MSFDISEDRLQTKATCTKCHGWLEINSDNREYIKSRLDHYTKNHRCYQGSSFTIKPVVPGRHLLKDDEGRGTEVFEVNYGYRRSGA